MNGLDTLVENFYQKHKLVGLCAAVVRGQHDIKIGAAGVRRAETQTLRKQQGF